MGRPPRPGRKKRDLRGKKLFENPETSSEEETPPPSESEDAIDNDDEDDEDDNTPLFQVRQTMRQSAVGSRSSQSRPPTAAAMARMPDSSQATTMGTTPSAFENAEEDVEDGREDSPEPLGGGPLSPEEPFMIGSATEEQLPAGQAAHFMAKNVSLTHISGASNKVRAHFLCLIVQPSCILLVLYAFSLISLLVKLQNLNFIEHFTSVFPDSK